MGDIAQFILENVNGTNITSTSDHLYDKLGQDLRLNDYRDDSNKPIVMFYTMKPSDTENDMLHNEAGPAVVFANAQGEYDPQDSGSAFYFVKSEKVDPNSEKWQNIYNQSAGKAMVSKGDISKEAESASGANEYDFD